MTEFVCYETQIFITANTSAQKGKEPLGKKVKEALYGPRQALRVPRG